MKCKPVFIGFTRETFLVISLYAVASRDFEYMGAGRGQVFRDYRPVNLTERAVNLNMEGHCM